MPENSEEAPREERCWSCSGRGWKDWRCLGPHEHEYVICTTCNGSGRLVWSVPITKGLAS